MKDKIKIYQSNYRIYIMNLRIIKKKIVIFINYLDMPKMKEINDIDVVLKYYLESKVYLYKIVIAKVIIEELILNDEKYKIEDD